MNRRGEITTATVILISLGALLLAPILLKTGNLFDRSADASNRRTAASLSGNDIVQITQVAAANDMNVTIDRSVSESKEVTDPKLTIGQKVGRFFAGLGMWGIIFIAISLLVFGGAPLVWLARKYAVMRQAFKNTVAAIRETDDDTYAKLKPKLAAKHDRRDRKLVDKMKAELQ